MSLLKNIFNKNTPSGVIDTAKEAVTDIGSVIDGLATSDEEKLNAKNKLAEITLGAINTAASYQRDVLVAEISGNSLQRNWRPIVMLTFAFIIVYRYFISPIFNFPAIELPEPFWDLLSVGMGGYVIGRSVEKVADKLTQNTDLTFLRKKDRK